jgi:hypothetical protein
MTAIISSKPSPLIFPALIVKDAPLVPRPQEPRVLIDGMRGGIHKSPMFCATGKLKQERELTAWIGRIYARSSVFRRCETPDRNGNASTATPSDPT